jgi:nicotinamide-nucleotide amidase
VQVDCRVSSPSGALNHGQLEAIAAECAQLLGDDFVCYGHDSLARVCAELLREQEKRLAVVETATGGLLAHAFTEVCGACKFFAGGVRLLLQRRQDAAARRPRGHPAPAWRGER